MVMISKTLKYIWIPRGSSHSIYSHTNDFYFIFCRLSESLKISPNWYALNSRTRINETYIPYSAEIMFFKSATVVTAEESSNCFYSWRLNSILSSISSTTPFLTMMLPLEDFPSSRYRYYWVINLRSISFFLYVVISDTFCFDFFILNSSTGRSMISANFCFRSPRVFLVSKYISLFFSSPSRGLLCFIKHQYFYISNSLGHFKSNAFSSMNKFMQLKNLISINVFFLKSSKLKTWYGLPTEKFLFNTIGSFTFSFYSIKW